MSFVRTDSRFMVYVLFSYQKAAPFPSCASLANNTPALAGQVQHLVRLTSRCVGTAEVAHGMAFPDTTPVDGHMASVQSNIALVWRVLVRSCSKKPGGVIIRDCRGWKRPGGRSASLCTTTAPEVGPAHGSPRCTRADANAEVNAPPFAALPGLRFAAAARAQRRPCPPAAAPAPAPPAARYLRARAARAVRAAGAEGRGGAGGGAGPGRGSTAVAAAAGAGGGCERARRRRGRGEAAVPPSPGTLP